MTRKDFNLIAATILGLSLNDPAEKRYVAEAFATALCPTNPNFDGWRFIDACMKP